MKNYKASVDGLNEEISKMVLEIQKDIINPLCDKYDMRFTCSNTYKDYDSHFGNANSDEWISLHNSSKEYCKEFMTEKDCEEFLALAEVLELKIGSSIIGELVEDYKPKIKHINKGL